MSTRSISWGKGGRCIRLTTYHHPVPLSWNLGALTSWNPLGLSRPVMRLLYFCFCWLIRTLIQIPRNQNGWLSSLICCNFFKISLPVLSTYQDTGVHADDILAHTDNDKIPLYWDIFHCITHTLSIRLYLHQTFQLFSNV